MDDTSRKPAWENSYSKRDNFLFYPNEEVIRFVSKYVCKQADLGKFEKLGEFSHPMVRWLDLGCGIGRHVVYGSAIGCEAFGIDLSATAIDFARRWASTVGIPNVESRLVVGGAAELPWDDGFFDVVVSHGVLDSMPFETAKVAVNEVSRVLAKHGKFYCDFIASTESLAPDGTAGEAIVSAAHEQGTVQSYFNRDKLDELISSYFSYLDLTLVGRHDLIRDRIRYRFHAVLERIEAES